MPDRRRRLPKTLGYESYTTLTSKQFKGSKRFPAERTAGDSGTPAANPAPVGDRPTPTTEQADLGGAQKIQPWADYFFTEAEWGPTGDCENAVRKARMDLLCNLEDVLGGIAFNRVSKWGQPIELRKPKEEYL